MADKAKKRIKPTYDDQFRASAVIMLQSQGYPDQKGALEIVAKHLHIPPNTLSRWAKGTSNPPPNNIVVGKKAEFRTLFTDEIYAIMGILPDKRDEASYGTLVTASGIFFDKIRLLDGLPTAIVAILPELVSELERSGVTPADVFQALLNRARAANAQH